MRLAMAEARRALEHDDVPIGAVVVHGDEVVGAGHNERELRQDPTAHAETIALRAAAAALGSWRVLDSTLYVTLEPCAMCAGAIVLARVPRVVFGCADPKAGAAGSVLDVLAEPRLNHRPAVVGGRARGSVRRAADRLLRLAPLSGRELESGGRNRASSGDEPGRRAMKHVFSVHQSWRRSGAMSSGRVVSAVTTATAMVVALCVPPAFGQFPSPPSTSTPSVTTPSVSVDVPPTTVQTPSVKVDVPATTVQAPKTPTVPKAPTVTAAPVRTPSATVTTPSAKVSTPSTTATTPAARVRAPSTATTTSGSTRTATGSSAPDRSTTSSGQRTADRSGASGSAANGSSRAGAPAAASRPGGSSRADGPAGTSRPGGSSASASRRGGGDGGDGGERRRSARRGDGGSERGTPAQRDRRLRRTVRGLERCLTGVPAAQRRVLVLRAGVGAARSRSRAEVARITGLSRRRVRRAESSGLRHLRRVARTTSCDAPPARAEVTGEDAAVLAADVARPAMPGLTPASLATARAGASDVPGISVLADHRFSTPIPGGESSAGSGLPIGPPDGDDVAELSVPLVAMMVLSCVALVALRARRTRHRDRWDPSAPW